jgi:RNA polymerase sigma-70 factor (ECF subfamily)
VRLNRAIALRYVHGAEAALSEVEPLATSLNRYYLFHATRAAILRELGRTAEADRAEMQGIELTKNSAERTMMAERLADALC